MLELCRDVTWVEPPPAPSTWRRLAGHALGPARPLARVLAARVRRSSMDADAADPPDPSVLLDPLARRVADDAIDIVWLGFGGISYPLVELKALTGRPLVLETESVWSRFLLRELPFQPDPALRQAIEAAGTAKAEEEGRYASVPDVTTAVSDVDAAYFRSLSSEPDRVMRLSNVIDVASYRQPGRRPATPDAGDLPTGHAGARNGQRGRRFVAARPDHAVSLEPGTPAPPLPGRARPADRAAAARRPARPCHRRGRLDRALPAPGAGHGRAAALGIGHPIQDPGSVRLSFAGDLDHARGGGARRHRLGGSSCSPMAPERSPTRS